MLEFLDLIFTFSYLEHAQGLNHSGFRQRTSLHRSRVTLQIPELGWSGFGMQLCYSLKSVEQSPSQKHWPWSVRHCAVYHSFDVEHIRTSWVIVKGDRETERRIQSVTSNGGAHELSVYDTIVNAFSSVMEIHLVLCDSAMENWRWYISFLEGKLQELTRATKSTAADIPLSPVTESPLSPLSKTATFGMSSQSQNPKKHQSQGYDKVPFTGTGSNSISKPVNGIPTPPREQRPQLTLYTSPKTGRTQPLPPGITAESLVSPKTRPVPNEIHGQKQFNFSDLQYTQHVEEKTSEILLAMDLNHQVVSQLGEYYQYIIENQDLPHNIRTECLGRVKDFLHRLNGVKCNLRLQMSRVEALLRLLADRKSLVSTCIR
ncbi:MAG: hypothetical protein Q9225_004919 [Loekoesia sp. 1 TL-2023]